MLQHDDGAHRNVTETRRHGLGPAIQLDDVASLSRAETDVVAVKHTDVGLETLALLGELNELGVGGPVGDESGNGHDDHPSSAE